jgi:hypothetical protein
VVGFVEEEHFRISHQGAGHGQALLLAARKLAHPGVALFLQREAVEHGLRVSSPPVEGAEEANGLEDRQLFVELRLLQGDAEAFAKLAPVALPGGVKDLHFSCVRFREPLEDLDRRRLASSVGPEETEALAAANLEIEAVDGHHVGIALHQSVTADGGVGSF